MLFKQGLGTEQHDPVENKIAMDHSFFINRLGDRSSVLQFPKISHDHSGVYTCKASNEAGSNTKRHRVAVTGGFSNDDILKSCIDPRE